MPEQMAFARKASGLVRGLSFWDAFGVGFMNQGLTPSMWVMISFGLGVYTGGNLIIGTLLSVLLCGFGFSLVWGILGGSMPRSGGEYIYNSRILHPIIGIAESFGNAFVWIMWIFVLAPWTIDPGLVMMFQFLGLRSCCRGGYPTLSRIFNLQCCELDRFAVCRIRYESLRYCAESDHGSGYSRLYDHFISIYVHLPRCIRTSME